MPSRSEDVLLVKLPRTLAAELRQHAAAWSAAYARGKRVPAPADGIEYPLPYIIAVLLRRDQRHRARSNRPRRHKYQG